ncbi:MAG TPA: ferric reductase-like transmembrane domain-containing protein [Streptosporangiaceae bacterium]|nr:ferric reductase-like transmembrane domain-containing protein [Streptosporangiaceae bacterium]
MTGVSLAAASTGSSPLWYATRATGVIALVLLTATVILGVGGIARIELPGLPRVVTAGLHRNISLLVVALVGVHVLTTVTDSYTRIGLTAAVVPFSSGYRTFWLGLGAVALDLLLAVLLTSLLRDRLPYRAWRAVHWLGYACWPVALWHGLGTGTDSRLPWLLALDALCVAAVTGAAGWRLSRAARGPVRTATITAAVLLPLVTAAFVLNGPLQPGWARRAGTPPALLSPAAGLAWARGGGLAWARGAGLAWARGAGQGSGPGAGPAAGPGAGLGSGPAAALRLAVAGAAAPAWLARRTAARS